ncbi:MAG: hypothetical protein QOE76_2028, partial [Frankiales bacterium]|nr:hypothetical protein [Frankiales bacterium]
MALRGTYWVRDTHRRQLANLMTTRVAQLDTPPCR